MNTPESHGAPSSAPSSSAASSALSAASSSVDLSPVSSSSTSSTPSTPSTPSPTSSPASPGHHAHALLLEHAENVVTKVIDRVPRPGTQQQLEEAIHAITAAVQRYPGHLGVHVTPPAPPFHPGYRVVYKFDTPEHLHAWEESEEQHRLVRQANRHTQGAPGYQVLTGLETWFTLPASPHLPPPPRNKMSVVSWLGIFPLVYGYGSIINALVPHDTPSVLRVLVNTALVVPTMSYVVGPRLTRLFKGWLYPQVKG